MDKLATTMVYGSYHTAAEDADILSNIIVIAFTIETGATVEAGDDQDADW